VRSGREGRQREVNRGTGYTTAGGWIDRVLLADVREYVSCAVDSSFRVRL
jgi:hypothetical protein